MIWFKKGFKFVVIIGLIVALSVTVAWQAFQLNRETGNDISTVATPTFSESSFMDENGTVILQIELNCSTYGAQIYYTLNGSIPTTAMILYSEPILLSSNTTVRARAFKADMQPSAIITLECNPFVPPQNTPKDLIFIDTD